MGELSKFLLAYLLVFFALATSISARASELRPFAGNGPFLFKLDEFRGTGQIALSDQRGKFILLHFFATYCEPCRPEMASLNRFLKSDTSESFAIVAVDVGEPDIRVRTFFAKEPVDFPILLDRDRAVSKAWGVSVLPTTIVLDKNLQPTLIVEGDLDWSQPDVTKKLNLLLNARKNSPRAGG